MPTVIEGDLVAGAARFAVVVSRFNATITEMLLEGALDALRRHGVASEHTTVVRCPGAFEIPLVARQLALTGSYRAVICLGAVIRGETFHFDLIAQGAASGIMQVALETGVPTTLGVLTPDTVEQAIERADTKARNKGAEAAISALEMASLLPRLQ